VDGVTGIWSPEDGKLVRKTFLTTGAIQNRGFFGSGVGVINKEGLYIRSDINRLSNVLNSEIFKILNALHPYAAIGNIGYTKNDNPIKTDVEPIRLEHKSESKYEFAITMDGDVVQPLRNELKKELEDDFKFNTKNVTELAGDLLYKYVMEDGVSFEAGKRFVDRLHGGSTYAITSLIFDKEKKEGYMVSINDDKAFEPLCFGTIDDVFVVSSESISHRALGGFLEREYTGAEMTICSKKGIDMERVRKEFLLRDKFEITYFFNPGSFSEGKQVYEYRIELGKISALNNKDSKAEIVVSIPDSGRGDAEGLSIGLGLPYESNALVKQPLGIRTFQLSNKELRELELILKTVGIDFLLEGKYVRTGDDSIVKGNVSRFGTVWWLYNCGVKGVEFGVSYGPMFFPSYKDWPRGPECLYELAVQQTFKGDNPYDKSYDEINKGVAKHIGVDRVVYNTTEDVKKVLGKGSYQSLDGSYPIINKYRPDYIRKELIKYHKYRG